MQWIGSVLTSFSLYTCNFDKIFPQVFFLTEGHVIIPKVLVMFSTFWGSFQNGDFLDEVYSNKVEMQQQYNL